MASSFFRWMYDVFASFIGEIFRKLFRSHLVKELDRKMMDTSKDDEIEINSSFSSRRYDVFASFRGEDVRRSLLSHLLNALNRKSINTFRDHEIERSLQIAPELSSAIRESRIAIVIFSKNYASSSWCLNELVKIHQCYKKLDQMVIPVFYDVDPSHVRKQTGEFGKVFKVTCKGKTEDQKRRWMQALSDVANMAGEDLQNWPDEAAMVERIAIDVLNKLISPTDDFGGFVGIEAHLEAVNSMLCLESEEARMVGILGTSGIGKTTIARALFSQHSSKFHYRAFITYKRTIRDDYGMKLCWEKKLLSEVLGPMDLKIEHLGMVEQRLKHKKVLIILDDVDDLELLKTLVGQTGWFGSGSRIIVITQDRRLLKAHKIDLVYEVEFPSKALALKMFCRSAFGQDSPLDGFMEVAVKIVEIAGNLPLGLSVIGLSLKGREKKECMKMLPELENGLGKNLFKIFRVSYDRLDDQECQELFLYIAFACIIFNGVQVSYIKDLLEDRLSVKLEVLDEKSFIRKTSPYETIEVPSLLQKFARKFVHAESTSNPGKRRFLVDAKDICDVFTDNTGTETLLGIYFDTSDINEPFPVNEKSFQGMLNLQFLIVCDYGWGRNSEGRLYLPQGLVYFPRKLRLIIWNNCPLECLPSNFKAEFLVELSMEDSKLEKLWEGTPPLGSLKKINMRNSRYLKEIPDLSKAKNLEKLYLFGCKSLWRLPSSIKYVNNLRRLNMGQCTKLESLPTHVNLKSLEYLNLRGCIRLRNFLQISLYNPTRFFYSEFESTIRYREQVSSSSPGRRFDVYSNFHAMDHVRIGFLSGLIKELDNKAIITFIDTMDQRSQAIFPSLISVIRDSRISIVIFSKRYASSSWCLDELVETHASYKKLDQLIVPVFYDVDPSEVKKQIRGFGKVFEKTCKGKPDDQKQRWMQALTDVANISGEISRNWSDEAAMFEKIADDISNKILTSSNVFGELVGLEAHKGNEFNIRKGGW